MAPPDVGRQLARLIEQLARGELPLVWMEQCACAPAPKPRPAPAPAIIAPAPRSPSRPKRLTTTPVAGVRSANFSPLFSAPDGPPPETLGPDSPPGDLLQRRLTERLDAVTLATTTPPAAGPSAAGRAPASPACARTPRLPTAGRLLLPDFGPDHRPALQALDTGTQEALPLAVAVALGGSVGAVSALLGALQVISHLMRLAPADAVSAAGSSCPGCAMLLATLALGRLILRALRLAGLCPVLACLLQVAGTQLRPDRQPLPLHWPSLETLAGHSDADLLGLLRVAAAPSAPGEGLDSSASPMALCLAVMAGSLGCSDPDPRPEDPPADMLPDGGHAWDTPSSTFGACDSRSRAELPLPRPRPAGSDPTASLALCPSPGPAFPR
ncbi:hypothetical protein H696_04146 [Fonticula alba]|uniref:Uncharacterized protein n=1 Tax=Fonticula alba TaxID=691883 RepID=A0A058Z878_FONAL|nr:hypothetical protein H696_04146 [Fonticula alba]KCV69742.1 hypothetical protein H696_04146 [Fonticula alba]|eukprot:XP_009496307.1 hypothetical protein H696_04146 [Fonticula alba]